MAGKENDESRRNQFEQELGRERYVERIPAKEGMIAGSSSEKKRVAAYCRVSTDSEEQLMSYVTQKQAYEDLINGANLTVRGPIYLRESDKQLSGTISYKIDGGTEQTADFQMQQAGDFLRNHTWIIYAYYAGSGRLQVQSLYVKDWSGKEMSHNFYNW